MCEYTSEIIVGCMFNADHLLKSSGNICLTLHAVQMKVVQPNVFTVKNVGFFMYHSLPIFTQNILCRVDTQ